MSERCTACSAPSALNEVVRSVSQTQVLRKRAIAAFPGRQKQNCVASLKSQVQAPQALLGQQQENFKVYNSYYYYHRLYKLPYGGLYAIIFSVHIYSFPGHTHHRREYILARSYATVYVHDLQSVVIALMHIAMVIYFL